MKAGRGMIAAPLPNRLQEGGRWVCVPSALMLLVVHKKRP